MCRIKPDELESRETLCTFIIKLVFNMPVILTVLYPNAAFRNHRTTETVSITKITASSDSHPVEFSSTSGLLPSQAAEMAIVPTMHHVRVKPEPCSLLAYGWNGVVSWSRGMNSGGIRSYWVWDASKTGILERYEVWTTAFFRLWGSVKVGLGLLVQYCCSQFWFHDKILVFFSTLVCV